MSLLTQALSANQTFRVIGLVGKDWQSANGFPGTGASLSPGTPINGGGVAPTLPVLTDLSQVPYLTSQEDYNTIINEQWMTAVSAAGNNPAKVLHDYLGKSATDPIKWTAIVSTMNTNNLTHLVTALPTGSSPPTPCNLTFRVQHAINNINATGDNYPVYDICGVHIAAQVWMDTPHASDTYLFANNAGAAATHLAAPMASSTLFGIDVSGGNTLVWTGTASLPYNAGGDESGYLAPWPTPPTAPPSGYTGLGYGMNFYEMTANGPPPLPVPSPFIPGCVTPQINPGVEVWWPNTYSTPNTTPLMTYGTRTATGTTWVNGGTGNPTNQHTAGFIYAISEPLVVPAEPDPTPPIDPAKIPLVNPRIGVCHPWCVINLPGGIGGNVVQPQPIQLSTKMRNVKRLHAARGWRRVTLEQYKNIKAGKATFLGGCYRKKK